MIPTQRLADAVPPFPSTGVGPGPRAENEARLGRRVGPYRLQRLLGHGGMGAVYLARRDDGEFEREVALKLIRSGGEDESSRRRFERERRILSRLEHPSIARLYEGGVDDESGLPWFAMERIEGESLTVWCASRRSSLRERVRLIVAAGNAVQYAHQQLVIHRDLKPSNILVDRDGAPHVLDFGIASMLDEHQTDRSAPQSTIHTPEYAAPEQIDGAPVSAATDVFTLGVLLFELLTGVRPFETADASAFEIQRAVLETPAPALASRLPQAPDDRHRLAAERSVTAVQWRRVLRSDLDAIVQKALEKRPQDRYPSMSALVEDLQRWLDGRPVQAARASVGYRALKFVRRRRLPLAIVTTVFLLLTAAMLASLYQARKAQQEAERAEVVKQFLVSLFEQARPGSGADSALSARQLLDEGRERLLHEMADQPRIAGQLLNTIGNAYLHLGDYTQAGLQLERALTQLPPDGDSLRPRLDVLVDLVDLHSHQGKTAEGERHAEEALAILARLRRAENSPWAWLDANLRLQPNYFGDAAQTLESRAEDLDLARARLMDVRGERSAAIQLRRTVADARDARPNEHPTRIRTAQNDLALALSQSGEIDEAITRFQRLLRDNEREFGDAHSSSITMRHNLALTLRRAGRLGEAEALARGNFALAARVLPERHPMHAYIANTLAGILRGQWRHREAQEWYAKARAVFDDQPEVDRDMLATVHYNESINLLAMGQTHAASAALDAAHAVWVVAFGGEYPRKLPMALQRVEIALHDGDAGEAQRLLDAADAVAAAKPAPEPREKLRRELLHAQLSWLRGDTAAAENALAAHWEEAAALFPEPQAERNAWLQWRARFALARGDAAAASALLESDAGKPRSPDHAPSPERQLLLAQIACATPAYPRCADHAVAADQAYAEFLPPSSWARRLSRAWKARAQVCERNGSAVVAQQLAVVLDPLVSERAAAPELEALRQPCR